MRFTPNHALAVVLMLAAVGVLVLASYPGQIRPEAGYFTAFILFALAAVVCLLQLVEDKIFEIEAKKREKESQSIHEEIEEIRKIMANAEAEDYKRFTNNYLP